MLPRPPQNGHMPQMPCNSHPHPQDVIIPDNGRTTALSRTVVDEKTMTLQYLEALKALGASAATKYVIPLEFVDLAQQIAGYASAALGPGAAEPKAG